MWKTTTTTTTTSTSPESINRGKVWHYDPDFASPQSDLYLTHFVIWINRDVFLTLNNKLMVCRLTWISYRAAKCLWSFPHLESKLKFLKNPLKQNYSTCSFFPYWIFHNAWICRYFHVTNWISEPIFLLMHYSVFVFYLFYFIWFCPLIHLWHAQWSLMCFLHLRNFPCFSFVFCFYHFKQQTTHIFTLIE